MDLQSPNLEDATIEDIFLELKKRFGHVLLATDSPANEIDSNIRDTQFHFAGGGIVALGLATAAKLHIEACFLSSNVSEEEDDGR